MTVVNSTKKGNKSLTDNFVINFNSTDDAINETMQSVSVKGIQDYIDEEIEKKFSNYKEVQNATIDQTAENSLRIDALEEETKNNTSIYFKYIHLEKKMKNLNKIFSFRRLREDWNGKDSDPITEKLIDIAYNFINNPNLNYQPSVFPTGRGSIQFEYQKSNGDYLEIEAFEDYYTLYSEIDLIETEKENLTIQEILGEINAFHSRR